MWVCVDVCAWMGVCSYPSAVLLTDNTIYFQGSLYSWRVRVLKLMRVMVVSMFV